MADIKMFEVGGCVRDDLMGIPTKDIDFAVIAPSFQAMRSHLVAEGFVLHVEHPEFVTIRAGVPKGHVLRERTRDADFVLARKDSAGSDGRRPDFVEPGTLADDLARRDFTVNAMARDPLTGDLIDPHGGQDDLRNGVLRFVGNPSERIAEDGLRVLRGLRFCITKGLEPTVDTWDALCSRDAARMLGLVSAERVRDEVERMMVHNTLGTLDLMADIPALTRLHIFRDGLRLSATLAQ